MTAPLFAVEDLRVALPDMTRKPLFGRRAAIEILKGLDFESAAGARRSASSANPAPARSTLGRTLVRLLEPTAGTHHTSTAATSRISASAAHAAAPARSADDLPGSVCPRSIRARRSARSSPRRCGCTAWRQAPPRRASAATALAPVGLPETFAARYPHELSGGQRQRVGIARAHRAVAELRARRRDRLRPRRVDPGADPRSAGAAARRDEFDARLHQPRSVGGPAAVRAA